MAVPSFLQQSKASGTVPHLDHGCILTADILQNPPNIEDLHFTDIDEGVVADPVLFDLIVKPGGPVLPRLRAFHLSGTLPLHMHTLRDMTESCQAVADICSSPVRRLAEVKLCRLISAADE